MDWAGAQCEVDFLQKCLFSSNKKSGMILHSEHKILYKHLFKGWKWKSTFLQKATLLVAKWIKKCRVGGKLHDWRIRLRSFSSLWIGLGPNMRSTFWKNVGFLVGQFSPNDFVHDRVRRGRSRRENSGKILAAAFSRRDFLMIFGGGVGSRETIISLTVPGRSIF